MIAINLTLIVQIINFCILYYVLDNYLLFPFLGRMFRQKDLERRLFAELRLKKQDLMNFIDEKETQLLKFQRNISQDFLFEQVVPPAIDLKEIGLEKITPTQIDQSHLERAILEKVISHG